MQDFRLMVNRSIRFALENDLTAKGSLVKLAQSMSKEYHINSSMPGRPLRSRSPLARGIGGD